MSKFHTKEIIHPTEIILRVEDINRSKEFYTKIMGFKIIEEANDKIILSADGNTPLITLIRPKGIIRKIPKRTGLYHFAILLPSRLELGLFLKHISKMEYPIIGGSNHGVSEAIYLEDPDDNGIEIYADTNIDTWIWEKDKVSMTTLPLDYKSLIDETNDLTWEGAPMDTIVGHIHLHVADLMDSKKFYVDVLGFDIVSELSNSALFISAGGYHHHIGLNIWNGKGAEPLPDNSCGMKYFTIKFPSKDILDEKINKLINLGYIVINNDEGIFTKDPSENLIKLTI